MPTNKIKLTKSMSEEQFDNGYWYSIELKEFAKKIGIPSASLLRKDELEKAIKHFLRSGEIEIPTKRHLKKVGIKDTEIGLSLELPIINYTSNKETKEFIIKETNKVEPNLKERPGVRYRLHHWREEQLIKGNKITYGDLIKHYIKLNKSKETFSRIPSGRYINFVSDFLKKEKDATRTKAIKAWEQLKKSNIPKTYKAWKNTKECLNKDL